MDAPSQPERPMRYCSVEAAAIGLAGGAAAVSGMVVGWEMPTPAECPQECPGPVDVPRDPRNPLRILCPTKRVCGMTVTIVPPEWTEQYRGE